MTVQWDFVYQICQRKRRMISKINLSSPVKQSMAREFYPGRLLAIFQLCDGVVLALQWLLVDCAVL